MKALLRRPLLFAALVIAAAVLVGGVLLGVALSSRDEPYPGLDALRRDDPAGADACQLLAEWIDGEHVDETGAPQDELVASAAAADYAAAAETPTIRVLASEEVLGLRLVNLDELRRACVRAGVEMPSRYR